ncbi:Hachiman antiphage defense system protein HamA [Altererythrobacter aquiaggeris]|uniref:Hachiman antiphage defense system protein HamA n=1 Tax=Aestuarierythrobacter aquiaggeris TaxID=1898396 RepID=UPI003017741A
MAAPPHIDWIKDTGERRQTACGQEIQIWELDPVDDQAILSAWAAHFRHHYCADADLPALVNGTGKSKAEFLNTILFPDAKVAPGPSLRSGDFGEILVADFIEFILGYWCPRELRYQDRWNRQDSTKGCDIVGFKFVNNKGESANDELYIFESKSGLSATKSNRLQDAVTDSMKDHLREAMTLNAMKQRLLVRGEAAQVEAVQRFQNETERPFRRINGAAAVLDIDVFATTKLEETDATGHKNVANLRLLVIKGPSLMQLVQALYEKAANEA